MEVQPRCKVEKYLSSFSPHFWSWVISLPGLVRPEAAAVTCSVPCVRPRVSPVRPRNSTCSCLT